MTGDRSLLGIRQWGLLAGAMAWSALLVPLAYLLPVESAPATESPPAAAMGAGNTMGTGNAMESLVHASGPRVMYVVVAPLAVCMVVTALLAARMDLGWPVAGGLAWALSVALLTAALVGTVTFLVGAYVVPTGVLLVVTCGSLRARRRVLAGVGG